MKRDAQTTLNPNLKLFALTVTAIIVALVAFTVGKSLWNNHEAAVAHVQQQMQEVAAQKAQQQAEQQKIVTLQDLYNRKIGDPPQWMHEQAKQGFLLSTAAHDLRGDFQKYDWDETVRDKPSACSETYPNQTQPMDGCDVQKADGSWTYSISYSDAEKQLRDDVDSYNSLASQVERALLDINKLPHQLDENGNPVSS